MNASSFQRRVVDWLSACFPVRATTDRAERTHRFLEEALELAQANGCSYSDAVKLVDYVYSRPIGQPFSEVGGVMVTLAGLCHASKIDMEEAADEELSRNWSRIAIIRQKQASRPDNSPLPQ